VYTQCLSYGNDLLASFPDHANVRMLSVCQYAQVEDDRTENKCAHIFFDFALLLNVENGIYVLIFTSLLSSWWTLVTFCRNQYKIKVCNENSEDIMIWSCQEDGAMLTSNDIDWYHKKCGLDHSSSIQVKLYTCIFKFTNSKAGQLVNKKQKNIWWWDFCTEKPYSSECIFKLPKPRGL